MTKGINRTILFESRVLIDIFRLCVSAVEVGQRGQRENEIPFSFENMSKRFCGMRTTQLFYDVNIVQIDALYKRNILDGRMWWLRQVMVSQPMSRPGWKGWMIGGNTRTDLRLAGVGTRAVENESFYRSSLLRYWTR